MRAIPGGLFLLLVCADMGMKQYIEDTYELQREQKTVFGNVVLRKVYNRGFLLNTLEDRQTLVKAVSAAAGAGVAAYDVWLFTGKGRRLRKLGMVFLSAGAFSNIYDRLIRGRVIDYIGVKCGNRFLSKVTANLADVYAVIGAVITGLSY